MKTVRSLIEDGLLVVGGIVGGSDERVEPWAVSLDEAMARIHQDYVVDYDNQDWVFGTWFALTEAAIERTSVTRDSRFVPRSN